MLEKNDPEYIAGLNERKRLKEEERQRYRDAFDPEAYEKEMERMRKIQRDAREAGKYFERMAAEKLGPGVPYRLKYNHDLEAYDDVEHDIWNDPRVIGCGSGIIKKK